MNGDRPRTVITPVAGRAIPAEAWQAYGVGVRDGMTGADVATVLSALDEAAESVLDKAEMCGECSARPDGCQCPTCESRMERVAAYRDLSGRLGGVS